MEPHELAPPERYKSHGGTVKVSGRTVPKKTGRFAFHLLRNRIFPIDFLCIGANANQQAMKSMGVFLHIVEHSPEERGISLAFQPLRYMVETVDSETGEHKDKDCVVWRTVILKKDESESSIESR
jgi:hypothetical protein